MPPRYQTRGYGRIHGLLILAGVALVVATLAAAAPRPQPSESSLARRIVSLVPAVTEMLVAMGAGNELVGVGSFGTLPPELDRVARVGGLTDPDTERILTLEPDLVVVYETQTDLRAQLLRAGIPWLFDYTHAGLSDIPQTLRALGQRTCRADEADAVARAMERDLDEIRDRVRGRSRPRTLLVFDRAPLSLRGMYASGGTGFLHDMLVTAGGANVFADVDRPAIQLTTELILARSPDVIIELRYGASRLGEEGLERERRSWQALASLPSLRTGRLHLIESDDIVVPGPRAAAGTQKLARLLHPEAFAAPGDAGRP